MIYLGNIRIPTSKLLESRLGSDMKDSISASGPMMRVSGPRPDTILAEPGRCLGEAGIKHDSMHICHALHRSSGPIREIDVI